MYGTNQPYYYDSEHNPAIVRLLLEAGVDANARDRYGGRTALMYATRRGRKDPLVVETIDLLISAGADVNILDADLQTALKDPAEFGYVELVRQLIQAGADPNLQDERGRTPFMYACGAIEYTDEQGPGPVREIVQIMLGAGADPDITDNEGHSAVYFGRNTPWLFQLLISAGGDPNIPDDEGDSPPSLRDLWLIWRRNQED
jgi:ankyrin repeat protein